MAQELIQEVRKITAEQVAKKQDAAQLKFPVIVEKIKAKAALGYSEITLAIFEINEYDKKLLEAEGFFVQMQSIQRDSGIDGLAQYYPGQKEWVISW